MEGLPRADTQTRRCYPAGCRISGAERMDHIGSKTQTAVKGHCIAGAHALGAQEDLSWT